MDNLKDKAIALGLCKPFQAAWNDDLVGMYKQGATWCMPRQYPSLEDMLPYDKMLTENDVYNSKKVDLILTGGVYILNESVGRVQINDYNVSNLYIGMNSTIEAEVRDNAILTTEIYGSTNLRLKIGKDARCNIWLYDNSCVQVLSGVANIFDKRR